MTRLADTLEATRVEDNLVLRDEATDTEIVLDADAREALAWALAALWPNALAKRCPKCKGTGAVPVPHDDATKDCPVCFGRGTI